MKILVIGFGVWYKILWSKMFVNGKDGPLCIIRSRKLMVVSDISCVKKRLEFSSVMKVVRLTLEPVHVLNISSII